jgi:phage baseplate assembly protein gpV
MSTSPLSLSQSLAARLGDPLAQWTEAFSAFADAFRVCMPGVVVSFDEDTQTVEVRPALTEQTVQGGVKQTIVLKNLEDVPIVIPRGGPFSLTLPIQPGDECIVIFGDMDIGAWWEAGSADKAQNQIHQRRHTMADGFALMGCWSQPRVLENYSTTSAQLRTEDGTVTVDIAAAAVTVTAPTITVHATSTAAVTAPTVNVAGSSAVNITGGHCSIDGKPFLTHTHSGVATGGGVTGPVV